MPYGRAAPIVLSGPERAELEGLARRRKAPQGLVPRARIVLRCAEGLADRAAAGEVGVGAHTIGEWRERFAKDRLDGLSDEPGSGAPRRIGDEAVAALVTRTLETMPAGGPPPGRPPQGEAAGPPPPPGGPGWRRVGPPPQRGGGLQRPTQ